MAYILPAKDTPWGSQFPAYLRSPDPMFPYAIIPTLEEVKRIIERIETAETSDLELPPFTIFYGLIFLQCDPKDIGVLGNNTLLSGCLFLLRQYVATMGPRGAGVSHISARSLDILVLTRSTSMFHLFLQNPTALDISVWILVLSCDGLDYASRDHLPNWEPRCFHH